MKYLITTPRLRLRQMELSDAPAMFDLNSDPEVIRYTGDVAFDDLEGAVKVIYYVQAQYAANGMGRLTVEIIETGEFIGWCGLKFFPETGEVDLGYRWSRRFWGKGYGTEAAEACLLYGFDVLGITKIKAKAMPENIGSLRILEKTGFVQVGVEEENGVVWWVFYCL